MTAVVGLDLSLTATGVATPVGVRTITSRGKAGDDLKQRQGRLAALRNGIVHAVTDGTPPLEPTLILVEAPAFDSRTGHQHDRSGLWWLVADDLLAWGHNVVEVTAGSLKRYATGKGNAGKDEVLAAVVRRYPDVEVTNNNEADSLVLRAMGCRAIGEPLEDSLPLTHLKAMDAVRWPEGIRS